MIRDDRVLGKPLRAYVSTQVAIEAISLVAADEGCFAYASDINQLGTFDGASWSWGIGVVYLDDLLDVNVSNPLDGQSLVWDAATTAWDAEYLVYSFLSLIDTPTSYDGQARRLVVVNPAEDALEFTADPHVDSVTFDTACAVPTTGEGVICWNDIERTLNIFTGLGPVLQVGHEIYVLGYNNTGALIPNGTAVYATGAYQGTPTMAKANAADHTKILGTVAITTMDVPNNSYGLTTIRGKVRDVDTSMWAAGSRLWLSDTEDGGFTDTRPGFPSYAIRAGGVTVSDPVAGEIFVGILGSPIDTVQNFWNGVLRESLDFLITSDGVTVTGSLSPQNGHDDMTMIFSDGLALLDTDPPVTIALTPGTDTNPQTNFVYIPQATKVLTVSTTDWPVAVEHIKIATVVLRSASATQADGALRNQNWNDHIQSTTIHQGHLSHIGERIRQEHAKWNTGTEGTLTIVAPSTPDDVYVAATAGTVYQMHRQAFPAMDMQTGDVIHVVNDSVAPFKTVTNLNGELLDASGNTLVNRSFAFVVWGVQNKSGEASQLMLNLPTNSYTSASQAISDPSNYSVYDIPPQFAGVGFLIARFILSQSAAGGGTWTLESTTDLRGYIPNIQAGAGAGGVGVSTFLGLTDTPATYVGAAGKAVTVASGETALEFTDGFVLLAGRAGGQQVHGGTGSGDDLILKSTSHATPGLVTLPDGEILAIGTYPPDGLIYAVGSQFYIKQFTANQDIIFLVTDGASGEEEVMRLDGAEQFVGIGEASPECLLDLGDNGVLRIQGGTTPAFPSGGAGFECTFDSDNTTVSATAGVSLFQSYSRASAAWRDLWIRGLNTQFDASAGLAMYIKSTGEVGIGEASPGARLHVKSGGDTASSYTAEFYSSGSVAGAGGVLLSQASTYAYKMHTTGTGGTAGKLYFSYITRSTGAYQYANVLVLYDGKVGVGATAPLSLLSNTNTNPTAGTIASTGFLWAVNANNTYAAIIDQAGTGGGGLRLQHNGSVGLAVYDDSLPRWEIFTTGGNVGLVGCSAQFGGGTGVLGIANASGVPSSNPTGGGVLYSVGGAGTWRGSGGTITTFGPAEPHCPTCGRDFVLEWKNEKTGHLIVCMWCLTKGLTEGVVERCSSEHTH